MKKKVLGLDVGISSLGWAVISYDEDNHENEIIDFGTRIWEVPEVSKTKETLTSKRREYRSKRRNIHRKQFRIQSLKKLFFDNGLITKEEYDLHLKNIKEGKYNSSNNLDFNPLYLRYKGLSDELTNLQILLALINVAKRRGYNNMFELEGEEDKDSRESIVKGDVLIKKYKYPIIAFYEEFANGNFLDPRPFLFRNNGSKNYDGEDIIDAISDEVNENKNFTFEELLDFIKNSNFSYKFVIVSQFEDDLKKLFKSEYKNNLVKFNEILSYIREKSKIETQNKKADDFVTFKRKDYEIEVNDFLDKQSSFKAKFENFKSKIFDIIFEQRPFEMGPGPINEEQRKIYEKNAKRYYKGFEDAIGKCTFYPNERRMSNFSIVSDVYVILKNIENTFKFSSNEKVEESELKILSQIGQEVIESFFKNRKISKKIVSEIFDKNNQIFEVKPGISFDLNSNFYLNSLDKIDSKFVDLNIGDYSFDKNNKNNKLEKLGEILYLNKTIELIEKKLKDLDSDYFKNSLEWYKENNKKFKTNKTFNYSKKFALDAINNFLNAESTISKFEASINERNKEIDTKKIKKPFSPINDRDMQRNKVVFRSVNETRKVVKTLFNKYIDFDDVIIEVASELYSEKSIRTKIENRNEKNLKYNQSIEKRLLELDKKINPSNIERYKLWDSQRRSSKDAMAFDPYDIELKNSIKENDIFSEEYQVDHIVPYSKYNNDTLSNKVLTTAMNNQNKKNRLPLDFLRDNNDSKSIQKWIENISKIYKNHNDKLNFLLMTDYNDEIVNGFVSKNINDTRYISKYISDYIEINWNKWNVLKALQDSKDNKKVTVVQGKVTSNFRRLWLRSDEEKYSVWSYDKPRDFTPFHHAIDAIIVALMKNENNVIFYKNLLRPFEYYNTLIKPPFNYSKHQILEELDILQNKINYEYERQYKFISDSQKQFYQWSIARVIDYLKDRISYFEGKLRHISLANSGINQDWLRPKIDDLPKLITNLIPIKLDIEMKEHQHIEGKKVPSVIFNDIVEPEEWMELNNKTIQEFPYVSYKVKSRIRGSLSNSENMISKKNALNDDGTLKNGIKSDSEGNYWKFNEYFGFEASNKIGLSPLMRIDLVNKKVGEYNKNPLISRNSVFIDNKTGNIYRYMSMENINSNLFNISHPNLYSPSSKHHSSIFKSSNKYNRSIKNFTKIEYKPITINILGKVVSKDNLDI